jgi:hypothetical protein
MLEVELKALFAYLQRILYVLLTILGVAEALGVKLDKTAIEGQPYRIQGQVDWIGQQLTLAGTGLSAIAGKCDTIIGLLDGINAPVLAAIAALPVGSALVNPPSAGENATGVWDYMAPGALYSAWTHQSWAGSLSRNLDNLTAFRQSYAPAFTVEGSWWDESVTPTILHNPAPDWADIRESDTRLTWLQRTDTSNTWVEDPYDGTPLAYGQPLTSEWPMRCAFTEADFNVWKSALRPAVVAPIWPGLANVTLGTPVALGADVTIPGPLDGVLVALTTPPSGLSNFSMGGQTWYYRAGQVAFVSDNGDTETWQYITWTNALYCPRQMYRASSAILRGLAGVEGTVTPWLTV